MEKWMKEVEQIRQVTNLPIVCVKVCEHEISQTQQEWEQKGWGLVSLASEHDAAYLVLIEAMQWPASSRSLLSLFFSRPEEKAPPTLHEQIAVWLQSMVTGLRQAPPERLDARWPWKEERLVFLIERNRTEGTGTWEALQSCLHPFFRETAAYAPKASSLAFFALSHAYSVLLLPISILEGAKERADLLEWASGLYDLISTEWMEPVRIIVSAPVAAPSSLEKTLAGQLLLSRALHQYRAQVMVAGDWMYPLERWAASLPAETAKSIARELAALMSVPQISSEQRETLETLFARQLNVSETARQLFLHRNTLLYRLDKLTEQTGLDPRQFPDAVLLQLYLLFRQH
ncbi:PucR family transcriptional regulator [Brevibacillus agri]|uniref:PucR family transcriptional regulator n=1 Tax=Brevibacillus agri TaxID=51101 RepID=UPI0024C080F8|nr:helix-turn-helix domain-containing protein [Brevibacillus agri]MED3498278.1 helix-turn-helix domain-containing protein [Brevibacillus agri]MED4571730.1 helix-turn-helix domain-containing protein [Brevibacillus agri]WHX32664.1 helix-turn-helix domain-containing protein [Brevibacillus agri]